MRVMLIWPRPEEEVAPLIEELQKAGHEIVYFVGHKTEHCNPAGSIYHDHYDAWDGKRAAALEDEKIAPISEEEIRSRYALESMILTMMNKHFDAAPVDQRKHLYYSALAYWKHVVESLKPEAILFPIVPHSIYNYILYELAQEQNIRTIMFEETVFEGWLMPYRDFRKGNELLRATLAKNLERGVAEEELHNEIREHWRHHTGPYRNTTKPWYQRELEKRVKGKGLLRIRAYALARSLRNGTAIRLLFSFLVGKLGSNLKRDYEKLVKPVDYTKPYIYFPLQFQPERTTSPQGGTFHDHLLAIETLSAALPPGWEIFVKEHPSQWLIRTKMQYNSVRWPGYYEQISKIPNTRLVPIGSSTYELTEHAQTVAVIAGSAAWEGVLRGKQPLVFGWVWYRDCPGVQNIRTVDDCRRALARVGSGRDERGILSFLKAFETTSIRTHIAQSENSDSGVSVRKGARVITEYILNELRSQ